METAPHLSTVAILGGGQLGSMLAEAAQPLRLRVHCLDPDSDAPALYNAQSFAEGDIRDARTVEAFGRHADVVTIEIENVSTEGLRRLRDDHGRRVCPSPEALAVIQDKGLQKQHFATHGVPTAPFALHADESTLRRAISSGALPYPFVQKVRTGGYDGKGVAIIRSEPDLESLMPGASLTEPLVPYVKELAVVVARRASGEVKSFPVVEMDFDPRQNLVTQLLSPARVPVQVANSAAAIAQNLALTLDICGLLAVEFFLLPDATLLVNEVAPRPHNSGHITMDGFATSQFEQHLRAILDWPLGSTEQYRPAVMINILGADAGSGPAAYEGLEEALAMPGVHVHLYGKSISKPHRKMGHVNMVAATMEEAIATAESVRGVLRAFAKTT